MTSTAPDFVAYEYLTVQTSREWESLYKDTYANFGWSVEGYGSGVPGSPSVALKLKRDRRIPNRTAVVDLQRRAEQGLATITRMERSKAATAVGASLTVGIIGAALLAGSVFSLEADHLALSIVLGAIGLIAWVLGYLTHGRVKARKVEQLAGPIDAQYDLVFAAGEEASRLLA